MEYWPGEEDFLKIRLKFGESHHLGFTFHYEHLLSKGYSLEEILEDFENIFLELRFCDRWFSNKYLLFISNTLLHKHLHCLLFCLQHHCLDSLYFFLENYSLK